MESIQIRKPSASDGAAVWALAKQAGLDENSVYCYLLLCHQFADSTAVALSDEQIVGFSAGFRLPDNPETLFVWQVGVAAEFKGKGLARALILWLCQQPAHPVHRIEATVTPTNIASQKLFSSVANALCAPWEYEHTLFSREDFGAAAHDAEKLFCIGPF